ncbi:Cu+-exporting ATPase [Mucilaginibacter oryzae]|uniref:Cu+-exporting ATPase n=1 Tax=Mucilaginibacter oryzae TaxID=468058 RepID=A0A316HGM3_9SPHI|nr:heavy metal-binding domain-containing protein [Mucilaginibacter oryzae]PWK79748.1 Cu+-exporting ATPase [Mucilaginibacter oryzae]
MKKNLILFALAALALGACNSTVKNKEKADTTAAAKKKGKYTCTMHPDLTFDKPGDCPKCGMALVERDTTTDKK